ncbi:hypothetical protein [Saccharothrix deserti]|nr:hypothetical protein [Saccharothrix deserti]
MARWVRVEDGKALTVAVPWARDRGTVTALGGDRATGVATDGSTRALDL